MNRETVTELLNKELDGLLTPAERNQLDALLAVDEDARILRRDLRTMSGLCAEVRPVEPPPGLRPAVRRAIEAGQHATVRPKRAASGILGLPDFLGWLLPQRSSPRLAYAFWGGLILGGLCGLVLTLMFIRGQRSPISEEEVLGSMMTGDRMEPAWTTISVSAPLVEGTMATRHSGPHEGLEIDLAYKGSGRLRLELGIGTRTVRMLSQLKEDQPRTAGPVQDAPATVEIQGGRLVVQGNRIADFRVLLDRPPTATEPVSVELFENATSLYKTLLFEDRGSDPPR